MEAMSIMLLRAPLCQSPAFAMPRVYLLHHYVVVKSLYKSSMAEMQPLAVLPYSHSHGLLSLPSCPQHQDRIEAGALISNTSGICFGDATSSSSPHSSRPRSSSNGQSSHESHVFSSRLAILRSPLLTSAMLS